MAPALLPDIMAGVQGSVDLTYARRRLRGADSLMFAGLFCYRNAPPPECWLDASVWQAALSPFLVPDIVGESRRSGVLVVESQRCNTPWSHSVRQVPFREDRLTVAFWGRLDNRNELAAELGGRDLPLETTPDAHLVAATWQRWGERMPERLVGDFALAVVDHARRCLFLARDPLGVKPLYYWAHQKGLIFATTASALRCMKGLTPTPDKEWILHYLLLPPLCMSRDRTAYREIRKLPPGHSLSVDYNGHTRLRRWHRWRDDAPAASRRNPRWLEAYRERLEEAVRCRMSSPYPLGTENSGGLDSAAVTAYLARLLGEPGDRLHSFGLALCEQEPEFIMETSRDSGITHNHLVTDRGGIDGNDEESIARNLQILGYPQEHGNGTGHTLFYRECERLGIRSLFSGFGGDEVVTNPGGHARLELLDQKRYGALWNILPGNPAARLLRFGKAVSTGYPQPDYSPDYLRAWKARWPLLPLRAEVIERFGLYKPYVEPARHGPPYRRINDWIINGLLPQGYIPTRLENCTLAAAAYGIDYCWPLWDVRLVQQYLSTPAIEKVGPKGIGRYLHRRAIVGTVPDKVAWKPTKDMGYARIQQELRETGIVEIAPRARREQARLHPAIGELLDQSRWNKQIEQAAKGNMTADFSFSFRRTTHAVAWLNQWLADA